MDFLTPALLVCSLYPDDTLLRALVDGQSQGMQFFVGDLTDLKSSAAADAAGAAALLAAVEKQHHRPALGLFGVPVDWANALGRRPSDLWDPCTNVSVATDKLSELDYACRHVPHLSRRTCIVRRFAVALGLPARQRTLFVRGILTAVSHRNQESSPPAGPLSPSSTSTDLFFENPTSASPSLPPWPSIFDGRQQ